MLDVVNYLRTAAMTMAAIGLPAVAAACSCMDSLGVCEKPPVATDPSRAVFIGVAREVSPTGAQRKEPSLLRVRIDVQENFIGADSATFEVFTSSQSSACGFSFSEGVSYLVEAYRTSAEPRWHVSLCSRTNTAANAAEDIEWLREWKQGRAQLGRIQGLATPGAKVRLTGNAGPLETTADASGIFEFKKLERRFYYVQGEGDTERFSIDLVGAACARVYLPRKQ
jgi:hypothetical protein